MSVCSSGGEWLLPRTQTCCQNTSSGSALYLELPGYTYIVWQSSTGK